MTLSTGVTPLPGKKAVMRRDKMEMYSLSAICGIAQSAQPGHMHRHPIDIVRKRCLEAESQLPAVYESTKYRVQSIRM
jgi:hypothetical protein